MRLLKSDIRKFWSKVAKETEDGCWLWTAGKFTRGYGAAIVGGKVQVASRVSWVLHHGDIPNGLSVLHNCPTGDNPSCVNPKHLWLGTQLDNMRDKMKKGRHVSPPREKHIETMKVCAARGETHCSAKITMKDREEIVRLHATGWTPQQIADHFGITRAPVWYHLKRAWAKQK